MSRLADPTDSYGTRVLLLEHSEELLELIASYLQRQPGLTVVGAVCGAEEALDLVQGLQPDVILADLDLPNSAGLETITSLRMSLPGAGIIAMALSDSSAYRRAALAAGGDAVVCKADLVTDLAPAIRRVSRARGGHRFTAEAILRQPV